MIEYYKKQTVTLDTLFFRDGDDAGFDKVWRDEDGNIIDTERRYFLRDTFSFNNKQEGQLKKKEEIKYGTERER